MQRAVVTEQKMRNLNVSHCKNLFISKPDETDAVAPPVNAQNDRLDVSATTTLHDADAECLLRTRPTFSHSVIVSVAVSNLGRSDMFFVEPGDKVNGTYYQDVLSKQQMLPDTLRMSGDFFIFQQDSAPAHRALVTIELLRLNPQTSLDQMSGQRIHQTSIQLTIGSGG